MLLFLSLTGIFLSAILLYFNARKFTSSIYLGIFFFLISLYGFIQYSVLYSKSVFLVAVVFLNIGFLSYLTGPMLYFYFRSILTDNPRLHKKDLWHLLPMAIFLAVTLSYILTPWAYKIDIATKVVEDSSYLGFFKGVLLYEIFPKNVVYLSRPLLILGYALWSSALFIRYIRLNRSSSVFSNQKYMTNWLIVLLGFLLIMVLSHLLVLNEAITKRNIQLFFTLNVLQVFSGVGLVGLLISPFFFPGILYGLPRFPEPTAVPTGLDNKFDLSPGCIRKSKINLESDYLLFIKKKTNSCMEGFQPYLQADCNLAYFSKISMIPVHHLAYYFREEKKQSFNDYRNEWRVKHAKNLIIEGKARELTIEGIGLLSGFATRNTFFTSFKKIEGISPGAFLVQFTGTTPPKILNM